MRYCRFENTLIDLRDCMEHMDEELSSNEEKCRVDLIELCEILAEQSEDSDY